MNLNRELNNLKSQLEEQERDADDILKKYQNHIQNVIFICFYSLYFEYLNLINYFLEVFVRFSSFH